MFSAVEARMDSVRDVVVTCASDDLLASAIYSAGKGAFVKDCARGFARSLVARGDMSAAREIMRVQNFRASGKKRSPGWCTDATLTLARKVCGVVDLVQVQCDGEDKVLIRPAVVSGDDDSAISGLATMMSSNETAEALAHSRIIGITAPNIVFEAALSAADSNRSKQYMRLLWEIYHLVGSDRKARRTILDTAVAFGTGDLKVSPPSPLEAQERMRMIALYSAPRLSDEEPAGPQRKRAGGASGPCVKCLDIEGFGAGRVFGESAVEVIKCSE